MLPLGRQAKNSRISAQRGAVQQGCAETRGGLRGCGAARRKCPLQAMNREAMNRGAQAPCPHGSYILARGDTYQPKDTSKMKCVLESDKY